MTAVSARAFGATKVTVTDISAHNLGLAEKMGATKTYCHAKTASPQDIASALKSILHPNIPEVIFDCVGMESTIRTAVFTAAPGSKVVVVGLGQENVLIPLSMLTLCELDVLGSLRYTNTVWHLFSQTQVAVSKTVTQLKCIEIVKNDCKSAVPSKHV